MQELRHQGFSISEIMEELGVARTTVRNAIKDIKLTKGRRKQIKNRGNEKSARTRTKHGDTTKVCPRGFASKARVAQERNDLASKVGPEADRSRFKPNETRSLAFASKVGGISLRPPREHLTAF